MKQKLLLVHGWSDCSTSFSDLKTSLIGLFKADDILFVDYESREDNMSFDDVTDGFRDRLIEKGIIGTNNLGKDGEELNVIVHSTGGLVIRDFISRYYGDNVEKCPIKRIVMLAPANFGSPLAHLGKSTLGSFAAGRKELGNFLETGKLILNGLELASPYQWELAERDVIHPTQFYSAKTIHVTVLVGKGQYDGIRQAVNKPGTDGTVVIAGTNLDTVRFSFNFTSGAHDFDRKQTVSETAFCVFDAPNHSSIVTEAALVNSDVHKTIREALSTKDEPEFLNLRKHLTKYTEDVYKKKDSQNNTLYQQFIVRVTDDFERPVRDYRLEFFVCTRDQLLTKADVKDESVLKNSILGFLDFSKLTDPLKKKSDEISYLICSEFYQHSTDPSYRRFLVNNKAVRDALISTSKELGQDALLAVKLHLPRIDRGICYDLSGLDNIVIYDPKHKSTGEPDIFYANTTTLLEFKVNRRNTYVFIDKAPSTQEQREKRYLQSIKNTFQ
jgi:hypothetical protein